MLDYHAHVEFNSVHDILLTLYSPGRFPMKAVAVFQSSVFGSSISSKSVSVVPLTIVTFRDGDDGLGLSS